MTSPRLLNLSLPKCGTLSVHAFFTDRRSAHELYGTSFLTAIALAQAQDQPGLVTQLLKRRYERSGLEVDASGFLHAVSRELIELYPNCCFLRVVREPISWISSYIDMLEAKAKELTYQGCLLNDRAARFEQFYLQRLSPSLQLSDLLNLHLWSGEQVSVLIAATAEYWARQTNLALVQLKHPQITTCLLEELSITLPQLRHQLFSDMADQRVRKRDARVRHNVSDQGSARQLIERWLHEKNFNQATKSILDQCEQLHDRLMLELHFPAISSSRQEPPLNSV
jgi:hypothetical protein